MSAIDFSMDIVRTPDPKGDRVNVVLSGKFCRTRRIDGDAPGRLAPRGVLPGAG